MSFFVYSPAPSVHIYTDASGSFGCDGVLHPSQWFQLQWPASWANMGIMVKELVPVVIKAALWGRSWCRMRVCFHVDNMGVVAIPLRNSAGGEVTHHLLRCLYFYSAIFLFEFSAEHVPGVRNTAADAVSHNNIALFFSLLLQASRVQIPVPLLDLLLSQQPSWGSARWITVQQYFALSLAPATLASYHSAPIITLPSARNSIFLLYH